MDALVGFGAKAESIRAQANARVMVVADDVSLDAMTASVLCREIVGLVITIATVDNW